MKSTHYNLRNLYRRNLDVLDKTTKFLSRQEAKEFFDFLEKIYEAGIINENESNGHKS